MNAAASAVAVVSVDLAERCLTRFAPNAARRPRFLSSQAALDRSIVVIVSRPIAPHDVVVVVAAEAAVSTAVAAKVVAVATELDLT